LFVEIGHARMGVTCANKVYPAHHGKGPDDGSGSKIKGDTMDIISNGENIQDARDVATLHLAQRYKVFEKKLILLI
jgi:hypothetical protein